MQKHIYLNPNNRNPAPFAAIEPPLWLGLLAGQSRNLGEDVAILDAEADDLTLEDTAKKALAGNGRVTIVVMGNNPSVSSTPKMPVTERLLKLIPDADVAGIHPEATGHNRLAMDRTLYGTPSVPWKLLDLSKYKAHNWHCLGDIDNRSPYGVLYTSLNCPFDCHYCNVHTLYPDHKVRYRPMENIQSELAYFANHGVKNIKIWDELFCFNEKRVEDICDFIIAQGFQFNFWAYARADVITTRMVSKMKKSGINWLAYGFESADYNVRNASHKKIADDKFGTAIKTSRDANINIMGNFMFGLPGETDGSMRKSLEYAIKQNFEYVNFYVALPYPGSQWYAELENKPQDWANFNQYGHSLNAEPEVVQFRDYAFMEYFNRREYLDMIKARFDIKAYNHIKAMLKWQIRKGGE